MIHRPAKTATVFDPVAAANAIVNGARAKADRAACPHAGTAAVAVLAVGVILAVVAMAVMLTNPATIPTWCVAHGGCS